MPPGIKCPRCKAAFDFAKKSLFIQKVEEGDDYQKVVYFARGFIVGLLVALAIALFAG